MTKQDILCKDTSQCMFHNDLMLTTRIVNIGNTGGCVMQRTLILIRHERMPSDTIVSPNGKSMPCHL